MTRRSGDCVCNLDRHAVWVKDILLGGLGHLMKMWILLGRLRTEPEEVNLLNKFRVADITIDCPQNSLEEPTSETTQITGSLET
jgi:hypothetical protein